MPATDGDVDIVDDNDDGFDDTDDADDDLVVPAARARNPILPWAVAGIFLVLAVLMAVVAARVNDERDSDQDDQAAVLELSGQVTAALFSLDYEDPDAQRSRIRELSTDDLYEQYEELLPGLQAFVEQTQGSIAVTVKDLYASDIDAGEARVIVVSDLTVESAAGGRLVNDVYTLVYAKKVDGVWKADQVDSLNLGGVSGILDTPAPDTTTTTAPSG